MGIKKIICQKIEYVNLHEIPSVTSLATFENYKKIKTEGTSSLVITTKHKPAGFYKEETLKIKVESSVYSSLDITSPKIFRIKLSDGSIIILGDFNSKVRFTKAEKKNDTNTLTYLRKSPL